MPSTLKPLIRLISLMSLLVGATATSLRAEASPTTVAAAANLRLALEEITPLFEKKTGHRLRIIYGSTGNLYRQITQGAPFEILLAADTAHPGRLVEEGRTEGRAQFYARGRLALVVRKSLGLTLDKDTTSLTWLAASGKIKRFAIANPVHAPYGEAAKVLMERRGVWMAFAKTIVYGENVGQTAQYVASGAADAGILAASLLRTPELVKSVTSILLPDDPSTNLAQDMVLLKGASDGARALKSFMTGEDARRVLKQHHYAVDRIPGR